MNYDVLQNKKVAVLVESQYIPEEIRIYKERFSQYGISVDFMSRLWNQTQMTFVGEVENQGETPQTMVVDTDFDKINMEDYGAIIMSANYTSVRLRYFEPVKDKPVTSDMVKAAPAVKFFAKAMANPQIIKGALCHGLWILTPNPELLNKRKVICHNVVMADVINTGAYYTDDPSGVVVDGDLVTGRTYHETALFVDKIVENIANTLRDESINKDTGVLFPKTNTSYEKSPGNYI